MKLGPLSKLGKRNTMTLRTFDNDFMTTNYDAISFWRFMANLHQSRNGIPDALSIILSFHYLTKAANRSKKFLTQA